MDEPQALVVVNEFTANSKRRFLLFIVLSIMIAFVLVLVGMSMYNSSGAAQLDLSRPGYVSVRSQAITNDGDFKNYTSTGPINQSTIDEFKTLYASQAQKTKAVDAFGGDPLSPDALGISAKSN